MKMTITLGIECASEDEAKKVLAAVEAIGASVEKAQAKKPAGKTKPAPAADTEEQNDDFLGSDFAGEGTEIGDGETEDDDFGVDETGDDGADAGGEDDDDDFGAAPAKKPAKTEKAPKVTLKDVNATLKAFAAKHPKKRAGTVALLKKHFKVESTTELDPKQYAEVVKKFSGKAG